MSYLEEQQAKLMQLLNLFRNPNLTTEIQRKITYNLIDCYRKIKKLEAVK
ncbi:MAG: hypothetical protein ACFFC1_06220 [Promethearchaeota archaeon]